MRKIKVGHIGTGCQHSGAVMQTMLKMPDVYDVVGVVDTDNKQDPDFDGVKRLTEEELFAIEGLDAVIVEPEEHCLTQYALKCVRRGLPIHMDKPAGEDYESFHEILKTAKAKGVPVHMGYMYRYNPAIRHCVELVKAGKLGEILSVETAMNTGHPDTFRTWIGTFKAGSMYIFGCHMIDLILTIQGMPKRILPFQKKTFIHGIDANDSGFALLEYEKGYSSVRINSAMVNGWGQRQLLVNGTEGTFEIKPLENPIIASISTQDMVESPFRNCKQPLEFKEKGRYDDMMLEFAEMVAEGKPNPYPYEYELALHRAHLIACGEPLEWNGAPKL